MVVNSDLNVLLKRFGQGDVGEEVARENFEHNIDVLLQRLDLINNLATSPESNALKVHYLPVHSREIPMITAFEMHLAATVPALIERWLPGLSKNGSKAPKRMGRASPRSKDTRRSGNFSQAVTRRTGRFTRYSRELRKYVFAYRAFYFGSGARASYKRQVCNMGFGPGFTVEAALLEL